jgi:hypothetical protein
MKNIEEDLSIFLFHLKILYKLEINKVAVLELLIYCFCDISQDTALHHWNEPFYKPKLIL